MMVGAEGPPLQQHILRLSIEDPIVEDPIVGGGVSLAVVRTPSMETIDDILSQPLDTVQLEQVMTEEQYETLAKQIGVYTTISEQLVAMHKAYVLAESTRVGMVYDPLMGKSIQKAITRQRWTPSQMQLQILESLFDQGKGTPTKTRIKEITANLSQHGQIVDTNVYNWFQNRKARAKRKHQLESTKDEDSEIDMDNDSPLSPKEKKPNFGEAQS